MRFLFFAFPDKSADFAGSFGIKSFRDGADQGSIFGKIQDHVRPTNRLQQPPMATNTDGQAYDNDEFGEQVTHFRRTLQRPSCRVKGNVSIEGCFDAVQKIEIHYRRGKLRLAPTSKLVALEPFSICKGNTTVIRLLIVFPRSISFAQKRFQGESLGRGGTLPSSVKVCLF